jgi:SagB-type dehydrogenase family enzyme
MSENLFTDRDPDSLSELFQTNTKLDRWSARSYGVSVELFNRWHARDDMGAVFDQPGKIYGWASSTALPSRAENSQLPFEHIITARRSATSFSGKELSAACLGYILQYAVGVTDASRALRAYASAGALYPLEVYVAVLAVQDCDAGLYHYSVHEHCLRKIRAGDYREPLAEALFAAGVVETASAAIIVSAIFHRSQIKYGERGYRMTLFEAGHMVQNILLCATAQAAAALPIGGFIDDDLNDMLGLDGVEESAIYPVLLGAS